jgi:hypothetical protein
MLAAAVLVAAAPAVARSRDFTAPLSSSGGVTVSWHGDAARGCQAAGLCGYRGSLTVRPGEYGQFEMTADGRRLQGAFGYIGVDSSPVIRVARDAEAACVDLLPRSQLAVEVRRVGAGRARIGLEWYGLSAGRCAGPDISGVLERLPTRTVSLERLRRGRVTIALPARVPYGTGRFSGTAVSNLRLRVGRFAPVRQSRSAGESPPGTPSHGTRLVRVVQVTALYRVTGLTGKLTARFGGLAGPVCTGFDACAVSGVSRWAVLSSAGGTVVVDAGARARPGDHGLRGALAALERRHAAVSAYGRFRHALGTTSAEVSRPGGATCRDTLQVPAPGLSFAVSYARIPLELGGEDEYQLTGGLVRTGCPGPPAAEVLGRHSIAAASVPLGALRARRLEVALRGAGRFRSRAYAGTRSSRFTLGLQRVRLHVAYRWRRAGG